MLTFQLMKIQKITIKMCILFEKIYTSKNCPEEKRQNKQKIICMFEIIFIMSFIVFSLYVKSVKYYNGFNEFLNKKCLQL